eukprot:TRINITY_DN62314_c0_g1_i1.p1 TRINITY_DN62314_c0_g1~~TRINITY_DN62314_c0_g1_i1.p1  ORF type:complete len:659 (+),score=79.10 TRINITY_DN62314_c0_g1_i1:55-2031(+)
MNNDLDSQPDYDDMILFFPARKRLRRLFGMPVSFNDPVLEEAFTASKLEELRKRTVPMGWLGLPVITLSVLQEVVLIFAADRLHNAHILTMCAWLGLLLMFACMTRSWWRRRATERTAVLHAASFFCLTLLANRYRALAITGTDRVAAYPTVDDSALRSDSMPIATATAVIMVFFVLLPLRCTRSIVHVVVLPLIYAALTVPLPLGEFEGGVSRRLNLTLRLAVVCAIGFAARISIEMSDRIAFLARVHLAQSLAREKTLRYSAEHEAEQGPFSAARTEDRTKPTSQLDDASTRSEHVTTRCENMTTRSEKTGISTMIFTPGQGLSNDASLNQIRLDAMKGLAVRESWLISEDQVQVFSGAECGEGGFGKVIRGRYANSDVAIKLPTRKNGVFELSQSLANELRVLRRLRHPHIISFYGACISLAAEEIVIVLVEELGPSTSLRDTAKSVDLRVAVKARSRDILSEICNALCYLHDCISPSVVHGDLKPDNILFDCKTFKTKLIDFGLSQLQKSNWKGKLGGTSRWMAPELLLEQSSQVDVATDIFSFGRLAFFTVTGLFPRPDLHHKDFRKESSLGAVPELQWSEAALDAPIALQECKELCGKCLAFAAALRPSAFQVLLEVERWPQEDQDSLHLTRQLTPLSETVKALRRPSVVTL